MADATTQLSTASILIVLAPSTLALVGVIWSNLYTAKRTREAEEFRSRAGVAHQVLAARREAELEVLGVVAEVSHMFHRFHNKMYGNPGKGKADRKSAAALDELGAAFDQMSHLRRWGTTLRAYGSPGIAEKIDEVDQAVKDRMEELNDDIPRFIAVKAGAFEEKLDALFDELASMIRDDIGVERAQKEVWGNGS
ncbi:hypothetical protein [Demequina sp. SO4-18]|uniref:hypothetical protein n=1 Tax=Demequina sp. SO4-18 TaxID=3401026 RepID=UPI003B5C686B